MFDWQVLPGRLVWHVSHQRQVSFTCDTLTLEHEVVTQPLPPLIPGHVECSGIIIVRDLLPRPDQFGHHTHHCVVDVILGDVLVTAGVQ